MAKSHLKGEVPDNVFNKEVSKYLKRVEANTTSKNTQAQFTYKGKKYYLERSPTQSGFRVRRSADFAAKEQRRRLLLSKPKLSSIEKMMIDNIYDEASKRGLEVDHRIPAKLKGMHHPSNLGLMTRKENGRKGSKTGPGFKYEPLIEKKNGNGNGHSNGNGNGHSNGKSNGHTSKLPASPRKKLFIGPKGASFRAVTPYLSYLPEIDELTGGHIDKLLQSGVNNLRMSLGFKPNNPNNKPKDFIEKGQDWLLNQLGINK
jgi:hypothetical protein